MRAFTRAGLSALVIAAFLAGGCNSDSQIRKLEARNLELDQRNRDLSKELADLRLKGAGYDTELAAKDRQIGALEESVEMLRREVGKGPAGPPALPPELAAALEQLKKSGTLISDVQGRHVRLEGDVLFDSGKADIKSGALTQLNALAKVIEQEGELFMVRVEGNTDSDPIRKSTWADNWQLSCERARAVLKALAQAGVPEERMFIGAYGMYNPRVSNDTAGNKQQNRRVELVLLPTKE